MIKNLEYCYHLWDTGRKLLPRWVIFPLSGGRKASESKHLKMRQEMGISDGIGLQTCPSPINMFRFFSVVKLLPLCDVCWILVCHLYVTNNSILKMNKAQTLGKSIWSWCCFLSLSFSPSPFLISVSFPPFLHKTSFATADRQWQKSTLCSCIVTAHRHSALSAEGISWEHATLEMLLVDVPFGGSRLVLLGPSRSVFQKWPLVYSLHTKYLCAVVPTVLGGTS